MFVKVLPTQLIGAHHVYRTSTLAVLMDFAKVVPKIVALVGMQQPARHVRRQTFICRIPSALNVPSTVLTVRALRIVQHAKVLISSRMEFASLVL